MAGGESGCETIEFEEAGYVLHSSNYYGSSPAQVGRDPWPARDAFVPLLEAGRRRQCASHTKRCETVPA